MTVAELLSRHGQDAELAQKLWEPLCIAALNTPIHKASVVVVPPRHYRDWLYADEREARALLQAMEAEQFVTMPAPRPLRVPVPGRGSDA